MGEPSGYVSIGNTNEVIRTLILERTTWPLFKECIGATKAEWKHCKLLLEKICGESLYDAIVQKLNCTLDQAKQAVDDFVNRADVLIKVGDIDVNVLAEIAKNHDELRELCEKPYPWNGIILMLLKLPKLRQKFQKWKKQYPLQKAAQ